MGFRRFRQCQCWDDLGLDDALPFYWRAAGWRKESANCEGGRQWGAVWQRAAPSADHRRCGTERKAQVSYSCDMICGSDRCKRMTSALSSSILWVLGHRHAPGAHHLAGTRSRRDSALCCPYPRPTRPVLPHGAFEGEHGHETPARPSRTRDRFPFMGDFPNVPAPPDGATGQRVPDPTTAGEARPRTPRRHVPDPHIQS
jgi:hypothetical protein